MRASEWAWARAGEGGPKGRVNRKTTTIRSLWAAALLALTILARPAAPVYPVKVSENGRYFIDQKGEPVFWLGTTQ